MKKLTIRELSRLSADEFRQADKLPLTVVLDDVRSLHNVGSVFRTADAFRLEGLVLCGITATPPQPEIHKTALGAECSVEWRYEPDACAVVDALVKSGVKVFCLEQVAESCALQQFSSQAGCRYALVLGNEVKGVRQEVVNLCTGALEIPQFGTKHSLNVSVAAGIAIWHLAQSMHFGQG